MWSRIKYSNVGTMSEMNLLFLGFLATFHITHATAFIPDPFPAPVKRSQETNTSSPLQIDLGYKDITTPQTYWMNGKASATQHHPPVVVGGKHHNLQSKSAVPSSKRMGYRINVRRADSIGMSRGMMWFSPTLPRILGKRTVCSWMYLPRHRRRIFLCWCGFTREDMGLEMACWIWVLSLMGIMGVLLALVFSTDCKF